MSNDGRRSDVQAGGDSRGCTGLKAVRDIEAVRERRQSSADAREGFVMRAQTPAAD